MDPVGPWSAYASYNRLAGVQAGAASGDFHHHLAGGAHGAASGVPSTTSQLLLQAAHTTASLAGQLGSSTASPFNPGGFLSPPPVGYDAVFSPLFHHPNPKPAHYSSTLQAQHRQAIAQAAAASKQSTVESELSTLRENYSSHHQSLAAAQGSSFFDQSTAPGGASGLAWQGNNQLPSPFGILPHESVVPSAQSPATTKSSSTPAAYDNFNAHFAASQTINNHLNTQLPTSGAKQSTRTTSPQASVPAKAASQSAASTTSTFFQTPSTFGNTTDNITTYTNATAKSGQLPAQDYAAGGKQRAGAIAAQQSGAAISQDPSAKMVEKKVNVPVTGPGSGFMASYLKFLQGERDTSPPPASRGGRKATWSRTNTTKAFTPTEQTKTESPAQQNANGAMGPNVNPSAGVSAPAMSAVGAPTPPALPAVQQAVTKTAEPADDPRYYSLNKDRKRKFDGTEDASYDGGEEEARRSNKPVLNVPSAPINEKGKKGRAGMNKPPPAVAPPQPAVPRKPRAPATPAAPAPPHQQYYYQQPDEVASHAASIDYANYGTEDDSHSTIKKLQQRNVQSTAAAVPASNTRTMEEMPYQSGEFVAIKSELNDIWPAIWRVDGKTLLQKYEPFDQNGKVLYRNISTYAAWNPENKKLYTQVLVRVRSHSHLETIVELLRNEAPNDDSEFIEKRLQDTMLYQDNFEVYIQTLISHALDPNFLTEIFQEEDDYFLSNVKTVDEITEQRAARVCTGWARGVAGALAAWPGLSMVTGGPETPCRACQRPSTTRAHLYGQPYNPATLEPTQPDIRLQYEKEIAICSGCSPRVRLYARLAHQKYLMFAECSKRVADKRLQHPHKDTTLILNELLADELWLSQLFRDVRQSWAEAEAMERKMRQAMSRQMM